MHQIEKVEGAWEEVVVPVDEPHGTSRNHLIVLQNTLQWNVATPRNKRDVWLLQGRRLLR